MASELRLECKFQMADLEAQLRELRERVVELEKLLAPAAFQPQAAPKPVTAAPPEPEIDEEILLVISAAVAAFLGKRAHVRQVRLVSSPAWAQQGRAYVQASHGIVVQR